MTERGDYLAQCETCDAPIFMNDKACGHDPETDTYACATCTAAYLEEVEQAHLPRRGAGMSDSRGETTEGER